MSMWNAAKAMWTEPAVTSRSTDVRRQDKVFAAVVLVAVVVEVVGRPNLGSRPAVIGLGLALVVAVLVRRVRSLAAVALGFGAFLAVDLAAVARNAAPVVLYSGAVVLVLVYSLFRWGAGRDVLIGMGIVALEFTVSTITDFSGPNDAVGGAAVLLFAAALGAAIRYRVLVRDQLVEQVKLHEREHLARELHDTVAHHVSAIAVQAQAGLILAHTSSESAAVEALETIECEAVRTLNEMRTMVGVLRDRSQSPSLAPQRHLADIERLAAGGTDSLRVSVEMRGDLTDLPVGVETAFYRVAQEAVTNAQRHARLATHVEVTVIGNATDLQLIVNDDGAPTAILKTPGYGLIGMTERVALLGGQLETGPAPDHGWRVRAILPRPRRET